jgi:hypothetical protein
MSDHEQTSGVSRRRVLRATAIGAAWAVPTVGVLGVGAAHADTPSGTPTTPPTVPTVEPTITPSQPTVSESTPPGNLPERTNRPPQAAPVREAPAGQEQALAFTGSETTTAATVAAGLVLGGAALTLASKRKPEGKHTA